MMHAVFAGAALFTSTPVRLHAEEQDRTMTDLNLAVLIFLVVLITQFVNWVGKNVLQEAVRFSFKPSTLPRPALPATGRG